VVPTTSQLLTASSANPDLDAEESTNYEIGVRSRFFDNKLSLDLAGYMMTIDKKIVSVDLGGYQSMYVNAGETSHKGVELQAMYAPVDFAELTLAYTYAVNEYEEYTRSGIDYSGKTLPRSPENRLNLRLNLKPLKDFNVELEMDDISSQYADSANTQEYSRPTLFNLRMKYRWNAWSFWAHLENITDEQYATYVSYSSSDAMKTLYPGKPRTLYAGVSFTW
jgi:iron complex outermembrane receptor protein